MIKAEALIGTVLGTCILQQLIGHGSLGAVYQAQQSRPRRRVAVKVFAPTTTLRPDQFATFLERFRQETDIAAALAHPNILPVHEYGEQDGIAYLVMPYVSGGTLQDVLKRERMLPFHTIVGYLEQIAAALDYAHAQGMVHRDIKPANMLLTPEGRLVLTDFGLVKVLLGEQTVQTRLTNPDETMGTPYYMAPEQIVGGKLDGRADIYSFGVTLYQMVTGEVPFQGKTPMQVALMHLRMPPRPPQQLRPNLPALAEQVILQTLAKRPDDRYARAQDLVTAFRLALGMSSEHPVSIQNAQRDAILPYAFGNPVVSVSAAMSHDSLRREPAQERFLPGWQTGAVPQASAHLGTSGPSTVLTKTNTAPTPATARPSSSVHVKKYAFRREDASETTPPPAPISDPILPASPKNVAPVVIDNTGVANTQTAFPETPTSVQRLQTPQTWVAPDQLPFPGEVAQQDFPDTAYQHEEPTGKLPRLTSTQQPQTPTTPVANRQPPQLSAEAEAEVEVERFDPLSPSPTANVQAGSSSAVSIIPPQTNTVLLSAPMKVIQVPVSGQPGQFVTGLLPVLPDVQPAETHKSFLKQHMRSVVLVALALLIVLGSGSFWFISTHLGQSAQQQSRAHTIVSSDPKATATARAIATATANTILSDSLSHNAHNWLTTTSGTKLYAFQNGAYHITDNDPREGAPVLLPDEMLQQPFAYTLTMEEIKGNETSINNAFGLIIRANTQNKGSRIITTFYSFEVVDKKGGEYQFWKYDDSQPGISPWKKLWRASLGTEFHVGHGLSSVNTFRIYTNGKTFTLIVNGKQVGVMQDSSFASGAIGMLVNLQGTEVAFSDLKLTAM